MCTRQPSAPGNDRCCGSLCCTALVPWCDVMALLGRARTTYLHYGGTNSLGRIFSDKFGYELTCRVALGGLDINVHEIIGV